jgi:hypothetical protein
VAGVAPEGLSKQGDRRGRVVTEKTVEVHLRNSDRKLAIRSGSRLARALLSRPAVAGAAPGARLATGAFRAGRRGGRLL